MVDPFKLYLESRARRARAESDLGPVRIEVQPSRPAAIWSGGQTGADAGALAGAQRAGTPTGGWAPAGWRTEEGPRPELGSRYGLREHASASYAVRTRAVLAGAAGVVLVTSRPSAGSDLTRREAQRARLPLVEIRCGGGGGSGPGAGSGAVPDEAVEAFRAAAARAASRVLAVLGHRESVHPGIARFVAELVERGLAGLAEPRPVEHVLEELVLRELCSDDVPLLGLRPLDLAQIVTAKARALAGLEPTVADVFDAVRALRARGFVAGGPDPTRFGATQAATYRSGA